MIQKSIQLICDICRESPAYAVETVDGRKMYLCQEHVNEYRQTYERSTIGERFKNKRFVNFIDNEETLKGYGYNRSQARSIKKMKDIGLRFVEWIDRGEFPFLLLYGSTGSGKTHLEAAIYHELVKRGVLTVYVEGDKLIHRMREMYNYNDSVEEALLEYTAPNGVVIIDDLTNIPDTATVKRGIYTIINNQYVTRSGLILSSNEEDIGYLIGEAAYDRFRIKPGAIYHANWPSFRLRSGGEQ